MMKKLMVLVVLGAVLGTVTLMNGCGASSSGTATTTTAAAGTTSTSITGTSSTTSTTVAPFASISGTVTLPGVAGVIWVGATVDDTFTTTEGWMSDMRYVTSAESSFAYTLPVTQAGTYYVIGQFCVGTTEVRVIPITGDLLGEYSDGNVPVSVGKPPYGTPDALVISSGSHLTGKNFPLNVTW